MGGKASHNPWGSSKVQRTLSVTVEAWERWTLLAEAAGINRSELFEVLSRSCTDTDLAATRNELLRTP